MDKFTTILTTIWTQLLHLVDMLINSLSTMSIEDLLKWMLVMIVIMVFAMGFLNATASLVNNSLTIIHRLFRYITMVAGVLIIVFWLFASERPCMFNAESAMTSCLKKEEWAKKQQELEKKQALEKKPATPSK